MPFDRIAFSDKIRRSKEHLAVENAEIIAETGIAEPRLAALMSGSVDPSGDEVLILADFFDCDYKFFISHEKLAAFEETDSLYRKHGEQFSKADRRSVQQFLYLCECESWLWNVTSKRKETFDFSPKGTNYKANGAKAALDLRRHLNYQEGQVPSDIFRDFRLLGIHIFRRKLMNSNISGVMIRHPKAGNCVLVNYDEDVYRQRFTAAHELAHAIMEDTAINLSMGNDGSNLVEVRANAFASHYLLPPEFLVSIASGVDAWTETVLVQWAAKLRVSTSMLRIALKERGIISEATFNDLKAARVPRKQKVDPELANQTGRTRERKAALLERGLSFHYVGQCIEILRAGQISRGRAAEMLLISEIELYEIEQLFSMGEAK
jgi:Zn-dependent peptidase ImmA (M78 family)